MMTRVAKLNGADIELGNFIVGLARRDTTCFEASRALLREVPGVSARSGASYSAAGGGDPWFNAQDRGRKFLPTNGGCAYIDLDHLELCLPEVLSAHDHVACWHAQLGLAQDALTAANARLPDGQRLQALVNNSDGLGNSYGAHLDMMITRRLWNDLFRRRPHYQAFLAAYQVSSIVFTGQGKVGSENGLPGDGYQISQRADMIETMTGEQTTYRRPLLNTRDEPLCGSRWPGPDSDPGWLPLGDALARLHIIFYDATLCQTATLLKVGVMQIVLTMMEAREVDSSLALEDPLMSLWLWSRDPGLRVAAPLASGGRRNAVELQCAFAENARRFVDAGGCDGFVPGAGEIMDLWEDTLDRLERRDFDGLSGRLDWVLKHSILERVLDGRPDLDWTSPEIKHLDLVYSSLDPSEGLFWAYSAAGDLEEPVSAARVEHFRHEPPEDTRAWGRAMWLRAAGRDAIARVDWDQLEVRVPRRYRHSYRRVSVDLSDPLGSTRDELHAAFEGAEGLELDELVERFPDASTADPDRFRHDDPIPSDGAPVALIPGNTNTRRN